MKSEKVPERLWYGLNTQRIFDDKGWRKLIKKLKEIGREYNMGDELTIPVISFVSAVNWAPVLQKELPYLRFRMMKNNYNHPEK